MLNIEKGAGVNGYTAPLDLKHRHVSLNTLNMFGKEWFTRG